MRKILMGLLVAGCAAAGAHATHARAAVPVGPWGMPVAVAPHTPRVQPVHYYEDWRHREWRRREAYERWRRQEARRRWQEEQRFRHGSPYAPGPRYGDYGGPRW